MPHVASLLSFLSAPLPSELLTFAIESEEAFNASVIGAGSGVLNSKVRRSRRLTDFGRLQVIFEERVRAVLPMLVSQLGLMPFVPRRFEIEMIAHTDSDFYGRHFDTFTGDERTQHGDRVVSCVYYFCRTPRPFTGGELKIYPLPTARCPTPEPIIVLPEHNTLAAFSSWTPHEVLPVSNPPQAFADSRFSINCWVYQVPQVAG